MSVAYAWKSMAMRSFSSNFYSFQGLLAPFFSTTFIHFLSFSFIFTLIFLGRRGHAARAALLPLLPSGLLPPFSVYVVCRAASTSGSRRPDSSRGHARSVRLSL